MKRSLVLRQLSREHHMALSLALRITKAADPQARNTLLATIPALFRDELEPHFQEEERSLLPQLTTVGETVLVERTLAEHAQLRALATAIGTGDASALAPFGTLLQAHVRFEERKLFAAAEAHLYTGGTADGD